MPGGAAPAGEGEGEGKQQGKGRRRLRTDGAFANTKGNNKEKQDQLLIAMLKSLLFLLQNMREVTAVVFDIFIAPTESPVITAMRNAGRTYTAQVRLWKESHSDGGNHPYAPSIHPCFHCASRQSCQT